MLVRVGMQPSLGGYFFEGLPSFNDIAGLSLQNMVFYVQMMHRVITRVTPNPSRIHNLAGNHQYPSFDLERTDPLFLHNQGLCLICQIPLV